MRHASIRMHLTTHNAKWPKVDSDTKVKAIANPPNVFADQHLQMRVEETEAYKGALRIIFVVAYTLYTISFSLK